MLLCFLVELCVIREQCLYWILCEFFLASPLSVGYYHLAELCSIVAEMVDPRDIIADRVIKLIQSVSYDRAPYMTNMERFGDIRRRVFNDNFFAVSYIRSAILGVFVVHFVYDFAREVRSVDKEVDISIHILHF